MFLYLACFFWDVLGATFNFSLGVKLFSLELMNQLLLLLFGLVIKHRDDFLIEGDVLVGLLLEHHQSLLFIKLIQI